MGARSKRIFIVCPRFRTGGPENQHQLCDYLNEQGAEAYMFYFPNPDQNHAPLYPEFENVRIAETIDGDTDSIIIIPEIYAIRDWKSAYPAATIAIWWLSHTNAALFGVLGNNLENSANAVHLFHSYYEYAMVRPHLAVSTRWLFLTDFIHDDYLQIDPRDYLDQKRDIVCFNANKDKITADVCEKAGVEYIGISQMTRDQVMATLRKCKLYVDNGFHPGKDHLPREAAMHGCVVITNKCGSAAYFEDVPIEEKVAYDGELAELIPKVLQNYDFYFDKQESYRDVIRNEKLLFQRNADEFLRHIAEWSRPTP